MNVSNHLGPKIRFIRKKMNDSGKQPSKNYNQNIDLIT